MLETWAVGLWEQLRIATAVTRRASRLMFLVFNFINIISGVRLQGVFPARNLRADRGEMAIGWNDVPNTASARYRLRRSQFDTIGTRVTQADTPCKSDVDASLAEVWRSSALFNVRRMAEEGGFAGCGGGGGAAAGGERAAVFGLANDSEILRRSGHGDDRAVVVAAVRVEIQDAVDARRVLETELGRDLVRVPCGIGDVPVRHVRSDWRPRHDSEGVPPARRWTRAAIERSRQRLVGGNGLRVLGQRRRHFAVVPSHAASHRIVVAPPVEGRSEGRVVRKSAERALVGREAEVVDRVIRQGLGSRIGGRGRKHLVIREVGRLAEHVADDVVVAVVGFELDGVRAGLLAAGRGSAEQILSVPVVPERGDEMARPVNVVSGHRDADVALPQDERVADRMLVRAGLLPVVGRFA